MKKILYHLLTAAVVLILTVLNQHLFYFAQNMQVEIPLKNYLVAFIVFFAFSFIKQAGLRYFALSFIIFLNFFQMLHLAYFGTKIMPAEFYLVFTQQGEIFATLKEDYIIFFLPFFLTLTPLVLLYFLNKRFHKFFYKSSIISFLFIFYLIYNPARTYITGNTWGRQPSNQEFDGMNVYLTGSYFLGRVLPHKLGEIKQNDSPLKEVIYNKNEASPLKIIFVLGESLSFNHMSLYGYQEKTTPFLESLKEDENFYFTKGISSGVSTDVALAFLINTTFGLRGKEMVFRGSQCLFKLARQNGFTTHFYSTQSAEQLRYISNSICPSFIDHYKNLEMISPETTDSNAADDNLLVDELEKVLAGKHFIVLHQRGSHSPYNLRYKEEIFPVKGSYNEQRLAQYDNTVYEFDRFMEKLILQIKSSDEKILMVLASDHGEGMGEVGVYGHGQLVSTSVEIPLLFYTHNIKIDELQKLPSYLTHFNISLFLSNQLGYETHPVFHELPKDYEVLGNDIDGFAGTMTINFRGDSYVIEK